MEKLRFQIDRFLDWLCQIAFGEYVDYIDDEEKTVCEVYYLKDFVTVRRNTEDGDIA